MTTSRDTLRTTIQQVDQAIRAADFKAIPALVQALLAQKLPLPELAPAASVLRRSGHNREALRLLRPTVYPSGQARLAGPPACQAEYAAALTRLGIRTEALHILRQVDPKLYPLSLLYQAFTHALRWDYDLAANPLQQFLQSPYPTQDPYAATIARVNLAASWLFLEKDTECEALLEQLIGNCTQWRYFLLLSSCYDLLAELKIRQGSFAAAKKRLKEARTILQQAPVIDAFLLTKQEQLLIYRQHPKTAKGQAAWKKLHRLATQRRHFETLRDIAFQKAQAEQNTQLALEVYQGTPYPAYRAKILRHFPHLQTHLERPQRRIYGAKKNLSATLYLATGLIENRGTPVGGLKKNQAPYRLTCALAGDWYRPQSVSELYEQLFPGRPFHLEGATNLIQQAIWKTRRAYEKGQLPIQICYGSDGFYHLESNPAQGLEMILPATSAEHTFDPTEDPALTTQVRHACNQWIKDKNKRNFRSQDWALFFKISVRTANRWLAIAAAKNWVTYQGKGKNTNFMVLQT